MATQNITIENGGWQDLITLGSLSLTNSQSYAIAIFDADDNEVCLADSKPDTSFRGNPLRERQNFTFTYTTGDKIWVKLGAVRLGAATVVLT